MNVKDMHEHIRICMEILKDGLLWVRHVSENLDIVAIVLKYSSLMFSTRVI